MKPYIIKWNINLNGNILRMEDDYYNKFCKNEIYVILREISNLPLDNLFCKKISILVSILKSRYKEINSILGVYDKENWTIETEKEIEYFIKLNKNIKRKLGEGSFSSAYLGSDNCVYKINMKPKEHDSWLDYAYYCSDVKNKFFPKVYEIQVFKNVYCIKVEKLETIKYDIFEEKYFGLKEAFKNNDLNNILRIVSSSESDSREIKEWFLITSKIKQETGAIWDIRFDNFLKRGNDLVINDPLAFGISSNFK